MTRVGSIYQNLIFPDFLLNIRNGYLYKYTYCMDLDHTHNRRNFVRKLGGLAGLLTLKPGLTAFADDQKFLAPEIPPDEDVTDNEDFWGFIQQAYSVSPNIINLNNGGVSPQPIVVQDALDRYNRLSNE